ncbi:hypothetical protein G9A89_012269 [Geosiphon pyriformis]|nr:hypothetical protein G9A89_012269 [Geosiphon pyriformis]
MRLRTNLSYAFWPLLALKDNPTMDMAIELAQRIENNQKMHLGSTLSVFAPAPVMAPASQIAATSFAAQTQDPNEQLIDRLTANFAQLLEPLAQAKKKAKVDFVLDPNKASKSFANNNEPPKTKVFKNPPKLESPEIVQKSGLYSVVKDLIETPAHIIFGQLMTHPQFRKNLHKLLILKKKTPKINKHSCQAELANNSNVTLLICKAQVAGYFIDLILNSGLSVSVIAKHFFKAISRKIDEPSIRPITNVYGDKKKDLDIAKAIPVHINSISIETDIEVSKAKDNSKLLDNVKANKEGIMVNGKLICWLYYDILRRIFDRKPGKKAKYSYWWHGLCVWCWCNKPLYSPSNEYKSCLIYYKNWEPISLIPQEELKEVQKSFENEPPEIQSLVIEQREPSPKEKKVDIENLLAKNSPIISKESDTPG